MITAAPPFPLRRVAARRQAVATLKALMTVRGALEPDGVATNTARTRLLEATLAEALQQAAPMADAAE